MKSDDINIPPMPELPMLPPYKPDPWYKDIRVTLLLIAGLLLCIMTFIYTHPAVPTNLYCVDDNTRITRFNNIQAAHTYDTPVINNNESVCLKVDDYGDLFGSSMQPTFFEGNTVLLKNYTTSMPIKTGDIIRYFRYTPIHPNCTSIHDAIANNSLGGSFVNNSMAVIHRVNAVYDDDIITQGDNLYELEDIDRCQITDIVVGIIFT